MAALGWTPRPARSYILVAVGNGDGGKHAPIMCFTAMTLGSMILVALPQIAGVDGCNDVGVVICPDCVRPYIANVSLLSERLKCVRVGVQRRGKWWIPLSSGGSSIKVVFTC